jgi:hypothetical protein
MPLSFPMLVLVSGLLLLQLRQAHSVCAARPLQRFSLHVATLSIHMYAAVPSEGFAILLQLARAGLLVGVGRVCSWSEGLCIACAACTCGGWWPGCCVLRLTATTQPCGSSYALSESGRTADAGSAVGVW